MTEDALEAVHTALTETAQAPEFTDFTIICEDDTYPVSRLIISTYSPYFKKACIGGFKEGSDHKITLQEDAPEAVRAMIEFFRGKEYDYEQNGLDGQLALHIEVFTVADKYEVPGLKDLAMRYFPLSLAELAGVDQVERLPSVTAHVYAVSLADGRLREALLRHWCGHGVVKSVAAQLSKLVGDFPDFGKDLIQALAEFSTVYEALEDSYYGKNGQEHYEAKVRDLADCSTHARRVFVALKMTPRIVEGLNAQSIANRCDLKVSDVLDAVQELLDLGKVYTTVDEQTWALLDI